MSTIAANIRNKKILGNTHGYNKFSFRPEEGTTYEQRCKGKEYVFINICPSSYKSVIEKDLSLKMLTEGYYSTESFMDSTIDLNSILDAIPGIQIREYQPDTKLDQALNIIKPLYEKFKTKFLGDKDFFEEFKIDDFKKKLLDLPNTLNRALNDGTYKSIENYLNVEMRNKYAKKDKLLVDSIFTIYYLLQTSTTNNWYTIPGITSSKDLYNSSGSAGWLDGSSSVSLMPKFIKDIPLLGSVVNSMFGNVGIDYTPWWNPESGSKTKEPEIKIEFDLFNDTLEAAKANFIFVNTLIAGNRWVQYGLFRGSSSLYDIKLEGYNRLFACAGDISVSYKGVLRQPSYFLNISLDTELSNKDIKIPDIYHVSLVFKSLLPANFNTYLFNIMSQNNLYTIKENNTASNILQTTVGKAIDSIFDNTSSTAAPVSDGNESMLDLMTKKKN